MQTNKSDYIKLLKQRVNHASFLIAILSKTILPCFHFRNWRRKEIPMLFIQTSLTHIHRTLFPNPSPYSPFDEMGIFNITLIGIQSKAKDLKNTKWHYRDSLLHDITQLMTK